MHLLAGNLLYTYLKISTAACQCTSSRLLSMLLSLEKGGVYSALETLVPCREPLRQHSRHVETNVPSLAVILLSFELHGCYEMDEHS